MAWREVTGDPAYYNSNLKIELLFEDEIYCKIEKQSLSDDYLKCSF